MRLREIAFSRCGDKGDVSNICVFPHDAADWERVRDGVTVDRVRALFGSLVTGRITRYEVPSVQGLNFVLEGALAGGVSMSLRTDPHGKSLQSLILDLEL